MNEFVLRAVVGAVKMAISYPVTMVVSEVLESEVPEGDTKFEKILRLTGIALIAGTAGMIVADQLIGKDPISEYLESKSDSDSDNEE